MEGSSGNCHAFRPPRDFFPAGVIGACAFAPPKLNQRREKKPLLLQCAGAFSWLQGGAKLFPGLAKPVLEPGTRAHASSRGGGQSFNGARVVLRATVYAHSCARMGVVASSWGSRERGLL
jgi:hypothetical protein